ncbi:MAG: restriction endonuclease subunit S [Lachnospiraceae bacterium]|nr:restriction endonuclease subunit S [Lachnospiraceae bacterium]
MKNKKNIPALRFPEFTDAWEQRKLGDIIDKLTGGASIAPDDYVEEGYRTIPKGAVNDTGVADMSGCKCVSEVFFKKNISSKTSTGELVTSLRDLVPTAPNMGRIVRIYGDSEDFLMPQGVYSIVLKKDSDEDFLIAYSNSPDYRKIIATEKNGSTQVHIRNGEFLNIDIPVPTYDEQKRIGATIKNLDNLITLHQRKCEAIKKYKKCMLQKMFPQNGEVVPKLRFPGFPDDWEQCKVGELVKDHNAGIYISKDNYGEGTNVIGVGNIYDSDIFDGEIYRLGPVDDDKFLLEEGDLIYGESSLVLEGIARTVCVGKNGAGSAFAWHTRRVKLDKTKVDSHFATLELNYHPVVRKYLMSVATQTALTGMTTDGYFSAPLFLPSIQEQRKISAVFKDIDNLITLHQRKCDVLKELKQGLLQHMLVSE